VAWQLTEAVEGIAQACEALGVPVVGGNVSLYNEAPTGPIYPTPVIGMLGRLPDPARAGRLGFAIEGDAIALVGSLDSAAAAGSELAKLRGETVGGPLPDLDGVAAAAAHERVRLLVNSGALNSAHDVSEGGLAVAIAESCIAGEVGARVTLPAGLDPFAEAPGRAFLVSGPEAALTGLPIIGRVGGDVLKIDGLVDIAVSVMRDTRARGLAQYL
jgi:phosphoribosylformylglycinamidine synthase subunit PurL